MNDRFSLQGKTALITGSSRGIGAALALGLAEAGADVAVHCAGNVGAAESVADKVRNLGRRACVIQCDLAEDDAPRRIAEAAREPLGEVDILIHNASVQKRTAWTELPREQFEREVNINFRAVFELSQLLVPAMCERGWGRVLMIGSVQQLSPSTEMPIYAATKSALDNLTLNLAKQLGPRGVTVNNLAPGVIATERNRDMLDDPQLRQHLESRLPARRLGQGEDCVGAALLLCSDAGSYITGQTLYVDGGLLLR